MWVLAFVLVCVLVLVVVCHADTPTPTHASLRVYVQNACVHSKLHRVCRHAECTHGEFHQTARTHTIHNNHHHNNTRNTERDRERQNKRETRQDKRRKERREKMKNKRREKIKEAQPKFEEGVIQVAGRNRAASFGGLDQKIPVGARESEICHLGTDLT